MTTLSLDQQTELLLRGAEHAYTPAELRSRLELAQKAGRPLRVKLGMDPTAPDLHLGHAVVLRKLREFQDLGHKAVLIIGDATAAIGDPTGKKKTRPILTLEQVDANARTYFEQAGRILDLAPEKVEIRHNSEWLHKMGFVDALKLAGKMTVARMLERDTFEQRYKAGEPIYIHEFMYPLMQGWDSVMVHSDVELGGTDQTFNNLVGRDLQIAEGQLPQIVLIMPILVGTDGTQKMSKSLGNYVGVSEPPPEQFGKTMSIPDAAMEQWFRLCTPLPEERIRSLLNPEETNPRNAKEVLGRLVVETYHGVQEATDAAEAFRRRFSERKLSAAVTRIHNLSPEQLVNGEMKLVDLLRQVFPDFKSSSEARRRIEQGAVSINSSKIVDPRAMVTPRDGDVVAAGKTLPLVKLSVPTPRA